MISQGIAAVPAKARRQPDRTERLPRAGDQDLVTLTLGPTVRCELQDNPPILPDEIALLAAFLGDDILRILRSDDE